MAFKIIGCKVLKDIPFHEPKQLRFRKSGRFVIGHSPLAKDEVCLSQKNIPSHEKQRQYAQELIERFRVRMFPEQYLQAFMNKEFIAGSLKANYDKVAELLGEYGYKPKIHMSHLKDSKNHFLTTYNFAYNLTREGGFSLSEKSRDNLLQAALLHDIGKALVPTEVFNKPGKFTPLEKEIMDLHSEFSYILLKNTGLSKETLSAIRNHHHTEHTGSLLTEILSLCDEASALKENRVYKKGFSDKKARVILKEDSDAGKIDKQVVRTGLDIMKAEPAKK